MKTPLTDLVEREIPPRMRNEYTAGLAKVARAFEEKLGAVTILLNQSAEHMADGETAPHDGWWKRYFEIDGAHMVLTEEGWEPAQLFFDMAEDDRPDFVDEVNAPEGKALKP